MNKDDLVLVSVDDDVVERPDVFEKHDVAVRSMGRGAAGVVDLNVGEMSKIAEGR